MYKPLSQRAKIKITPAGIRAAKSILYDPKTSRDNTATALISLRRLARGQTVPTELRDEAKTVLAEYRKVCKKIDSVIGD